jgi:hypothetical protein
MRGFPTGSDSSGAATFVNLTLQRFSERASRPRRRVTAFTAV